MNYRDYLRCGRPYKAKPYFQIKSPNSIENEYEDNRMILAKDQYYDLNSIYTKINNNVLVVGPSGSGKTRSVVIPNILQAVGSYIISDPKGNLYDKYNEYLKEKGYRVLRLDFINPEKSIHYNPFNYIHNTRDIIKYSNMLLFSDKNKVNSTEPYWDLAAKELLTSLLSYLIEFTPENYHTIENVLRLAMNCKISENGRKSVTEQLMAIAEQKNPNSFAVRKFNQVMVGATKTIQSILVTLTMRLGNLDFPELNDMMLYDEVDITSIGTTKTALFVVISDTDRSMDNIANLFFTQAMNELCYFADNYCENNALPIHTRFIMDDFATNVQIFDFPRMISSYRSRNISSMLMIQTESQLEQLYGYDKNTIIGNCDTYLYLGGNDLETAEHISKRTNLPLKKILYMPIGTNWIFRRGEEPFNGINFELEDYEQIKGNENEL
jgi:type IV secretion system protein VirD4